MKTIGLLFSAALLLSSCAVTQKTASTAQVSAESHAASVASLKVGERVKVEMDVTKPIRKGGWKNIRQAVDAKALEAAGGADVLLEPRYVVEKRQGLFRSKITKVAVSGRPAVYTDFHALPDSVWCNRIYRAGFQDMITRDGGNPKTYKNRIKDVAPESSSESEEVNESSEFEDMLGNRSYRKRIRSKGFAMHGSFGIGGLNANKELEGIAYSGMLGLGYDITPHWYAGIGGSVYGHDYRSISFPIFAEGRYYLSKRNTSPFASFRLGVALPKENVSDHNLLPSVGLGIGYQIGHFEIAFDYTHTEFEYKHFGGYGESNWWGFRLGFHF